MIKCHGYGVAPSAVEALARIALASLEAVPVAYLNRFTGRSFELEQQPGADKDPDVYIPLYAALPSPVVPDDFALVPKKLTAENGAKSVLLGEFSETKFINCPECFGDDECETCDGSGIIEITVPVTWTTIKAIWAKGVEHFASAPQQEASND
ncbi:hypothetical protein AABD57_04245 [Edwardsiella piscicida]|nr:hypothetical protein [Edwardsiella piscicida]WLJ48281.1 hypothetical protein Q8A59_12085 [Edwardsiella piscicida]